MNAVKKYKRDSAFNVIIKPDWLCLKSYHQLIVFCFWNVSRCTKED